MCGTPSAPPPPPAVPEAPVAPEVRSAESTADRDKRRRAGRSTVLTSTRGVTDSGVTAQKTLLGQ